MATYLIKYDNGGSISAESFKSRDDAIDYINEVNQLGSKIITEISDLGRDKYKVVFDDNNSIILTVAKCISTIKYDLRISRNGERIQTRRFSSRDLAASFARKTLSSMGVPSNYDEDIIGQWTRHIFTTGDEIRLELSLVTVVSKNNDYDLLGLKKSSSMDEVKKAYRKLAFKLHPDRGGNAEEFAKVSDAYNRIISGEAKSHDQHVSNRFRSINFREYVKNKVKNPKSKQMPSFSSNAYVKEAMNNSALLSEASSQATGLFIRGVIELVVGVLLSMGAYIFIGLVVAGIINGLKGLYYIIFPEKLLEKALTQK